MFSSFSSASGLLSIVLLIVSGLLPPAVGAEDWEHAYVTKVDGVTYVHADVQFYVEPEAVEAGQQVRVNVKVRPPPPASEVFRGIRVRVLYPDGRSEFHG
ncbi:MAG: hypothetical protein H5T90_09405, partial [Acetomicrobium sp.]|nr:hypothetical protein [Acetomicrobium sp.]